VFARALLLLQARNVMFGKAGFHIIDFGEMKKIGDTCTSAISQQDIFTLDLQPETVSPEVDLMCMATMFAQCLKGTRFSGQTRKELEQFATAQVYPPLLSFSSSFFLSFFFFLLLLLFIPLFFFFLHRLASALSI
jgi:hypothetical protein